MSSQQAIRFLSKGTRFDGRKPLDFREVTVEYGVSKNAEGSARVRIGETEVIAGVKMALEKPYSDTPDQGNLMVGAELLPISNPSFEPGPPTMYGIEIARIADRLIRESKAIDVKKLCVKEGERVWTVNVDICTLNDAGNLFDAACLASLAAIRDARFPHVDEHGNVDYKKKTDEGLPLSKVPVSITLLKMGRYIICDPTIEEEASYDARLTIGTTEEGIICSLQKGGEGPLSIDDVSQMVDIALEKASELRKTL